MTNGIGLHERSIEVNAVHHTIDAQNLDPVPFRFDNRRVVADANEKPVRGSREAVPDPADQLALGEIGNRRMALVSGFSLHLEDGAAAALLGIVGRARFADDRDLDLAGVFQFVLDPAGNVFRQPYRFFIRDFLAFDHDSDFPPGLERE
jgi:hypothetical protein